MARVIDHRAIPNGDGAFRPHWTREQLGRAYDLGLFAPDERLELIAGEVFQKVTMKPAHVIEISDATLRFDQGRKAAYYAEAGIPEYWIVNLNQRQVEIHRNPQISSANEWGFSYGVITVAADTDAIHPLLAPDIAVRVADLLPPVTA